MTPYEVELSTLMDQYQAGDIDQNEFFGRASNLHSLSFTKGYLQEALRTMRKELKQDIRSYVDRAIQDWSNLSAEEIYKQLEDQAPDRHGSRWEATEDRDLAVEVSAFAKRMAQKHGRTEEAIKLRIHKQRLLW